MERIGPKGFAVLRLNDQASGGGAGFNLIRRSGKEVHKYHVNHAECSETHNYKDFRRLDGSSNPEHLEAIKRLSSSINHKDVRSGQVNVQNFHECLGAFKLDFHSQVKITDYRAYVSLIPGGYPLERYTGPVEGTINSGHAGESRWVFVEFFEKSCEEFVGRTPGLVPLPALWAS